MDDTISRAAAIDAVNNMIRRKFGISADLGTGALLELPAATDTNVGGTDCISRQAILDAVDGVTWYHQNQHGEMVHGANSDEHQAWYKADDIYHVLDTLPSAQPELSPCDVCRYYPPSSMDGKPCTICPAERKNDE